jgi:Holliday junction resolvase RusA-like endonuclease
MREPISFFVDGEPRAKQSFRVAGRGRGFTPARVKAWQSDVGWCAQMAMRRLEMIEPLEGNLTVELTFFLGNARKIDLDNLSKAVQDGLNNLTWLDDQQNITLILNKYICREQQGVLVKIKESDRKVEVTLEEMKSMIDLARFDLYPVFSDPALEVATA